MKNKYVEQNFLLKEKRMYILNAGIDRNIISRRRHFFFKNLLQKESAAIMSLSFLALVYEGYISELDPERPPHPKVSLYVGLYLYVYV